MVPEITPERRPNGAQKNVIVQSNCFIGSDLFSVVSLSLDLLFVFLKMFW